MNVKVKWVDGMLFVGESGSGHAVIMDGAVEGGGHNLGVRPMEMLLLGLGGCTAYDVVLILRRGRDPVNGCTVAIEAERAETDPRVFTKIHMKYVVSGRGLSAAKVERAIQLSKEKYCSASAIMGATATITHEFSVTEDRDLAG
jgi:putative redox protein